MATLTALSVRISAVAATFSGAGPHRDALMVAFTALSAVMVAFAAADAALRIARRARCGITLVGSS
ncbi:hypothetical protein [Amycolatopsis sp. CA-230715]|uniref:hypothetical protein n=1 Tax=Amycolatopsis sp. CA-230715 TaxID=2745196 RepID=UPI001C010661|nr:hypothetical protein [Amycolatopsis sp. CA-230715]